MAYELAFVDSISDTATVRLSLHSGPWTTKGQDMGTDFGMPPLLRAVVSTRLADGERVPAATYGNRTITLVLDVNPSLSNDDGVAQIQKLSRELDRTSNFLRYRPGTTNPVFFRTLRSDYQSLRWDPVLRRATVTLLAEPFAYGLPTTLASATINNDPAAVTNPMYFDIAGVPGDVDAVCRIKESALNWFGLTALLAVRRRGTPSNWPLVQQAEALTQGTDTATQPNDAAMSGAGNNYSRVTFATNATTNVSRLASSAFPGTATVDNRGTYRVFIRYRRSSATGTINLQLRAGGDNDRPTISTVATQLTTNATLADMGLVSCPSGQDPVTAGPSGVEIPPLGLFVDVRAERLSGTSTLDIDYLLWVPADDQLCVIKFGNDVTNGGYMIDSANDVVQGWWTSGGNEVVQSGSDIAAVGSLPTLRPGVTNRIYVVSAVGATDSNLVTFPNVTLTVTYWPRYLHIRPVGS